MINTQELNSTVQGGKKQTKKQQQQKSNNQKLIYISVNSVTLRLF